MPMMGQLQQEVRGEAGMARQPRSIVLDPYWMDIKMNDYKLVHPHKISILIYLSIDQFLGFLFLP